MADELLPPSGGLRDLDYAAIIGYLVLTFGVAAWMSRRQKSTEDFFLGGRRLPWFAVGLSILATLMSTQSYVGVPGEAIKRGIGLFLGSLAIPFSVYVIFCYWVPFFMRLRVTSAYEYLEQRFNGVARLLAATLFVFLRIGWMSMVMYVVAMTIDTMKGPDLAWLPGPDIYWWISAIGAASAVYAVLGGMEAVIWTDVLQFALMLGGVLLALGTVLFVTHTGPVDWWRMATVNMPQSTSPPLISFDVFDPLVKVTIVTAMCHDFFWTICTHGSDQVVLQRYFATTSLPAARRSYLTNVGCDLLMKSLLLLAGFAILAFYLDRPARLPETISVKGTPDKLFIHFLATELPLGCAGLIVAGFLCDAMQTLESGVNSMAAVVSSDFINRFRTGGTRLISDLALARLLAVLVTAIVTLVACYIPILMQSHNIIEMMPKMFNMFLGPLAALFFIGMFLPHCSARTAVPAVLCGIAVSVIWSWWKEIFGTTSPTFTLAIALPCTTSVLTAAILGVVFEGTSAKDRGYSWWAVMKRQPNDAEPENAT
ncbi:MAG: sodium/solute symporter [Planctomycetaceae bacterium]